MQLTAIRKSELFYGTGESYLFTFYPEFQVTLSLLDSSQTGRQSDFNEGNRSYVLIDTVMSCMRVYRKQALSRVKYYYYATISKIQQATIMTV